MIKGKKSVGPGDVALNLIYSLTGLVHIDRGNA